MSAAEPLLPPLEAAALAAEAQVWCAQHGLVVAAEAEATFTHAPLSLLPTPFPRPAFEQALRLAAPFATLCAAVAADDAFLTSTLASACASDPFTARLLLLHRQASAQPHASSVELALLRSDYMVDEPSGALLQVEINTIAASFGCLSALTGQLHRQLLPRMGLDARYPASSLPANGAREGLAGGLAQAWRAAGSAGSVLFVVQPGERNVFDQQWLQATLWSEHGVRCVRRTLAQVAAQGRVDAQGGLHVGDDHVSVVYFRSGYTPDDYPGEAEWQGRSLLECSAAVKCPSIRWHLAGAKKVQQELARPGVLERFVGGESAALLRGCFAGLWALDGDDAEEVVAMALAEPEGFVLKPQREGGGNNLYGAEMCARLGDREGLGAFILMRRIRPPMNRALFLRLGKVTAAEALGELGVYSVYCARGGEVLVNEGVGHLLRTKTASSNEGGVAAGFAVLDSPLLVD